jgi:hypothetical protein
LEDILDVDLKSFKVVLFKFKWYILFLQGDERTIIDHDNGFAMINTTRYDLSTNPCVLTSECEQEFYSCVLGRVGWLFVVIFCPRGRPIKYVPGEDEEYVDSRRERRSIRKRHP